MHILGFDIGGTKSIVGVADETGTVLAKKRIETRGHLGPAQALTRLKAAAHEVVCESGAKVDAIGIGCGGPLDRRSGIIHVVPNLPGWQGICLTHEFGNEFDVPAYLENDANAAAMGEHFFGAGKGVDDFVFLIVGTGIGGGIIANGKIYRGYGENAGEIGHHKIRPEGPPCPCGDRGCLESLASGTSIARIARDRLASKPKTVLWDWIASPGEVTAEMVARAARKGDEFASRVWFECMENLGIGVANVVNIFNPRLVIIGGGVTKAGDMLFEPVRKVVRERAMPELAKDVEIVPAANGELMGLMGAFAVALTETSTL
ncbi:MAG: ROK family protein [Armatimonadetes bacterium]|nr:ROK family protein [Armatimonadota bacterium]